MSDMTREEAIEFIHDIQTDAVYSILTEEKEALDMAISALSENKGEWKMPVQDDGMSDPIYYQVRCSQCGFDIDPQTWHEELHRHGADNFCPNCGADMRGNANE